MDWSGSIGVSGGNGKDASAVLIVELKAAVQLWTKTNASASATATVPASASASSRGKSSGALQSVVLTVQYLRSIAVTRPSAIPDDIHKMILFIISNSIKSPDVGDSDLLDLLCTLELILTDTKSHVLYLLKPLEKYYIYSAQMLSYLLNKALNTMNSTSGLTSGSGCNSSNNGGGKGSIITSAKPLLISASPALQGVINHLLEPSLVAKVLSTTASSHHSILLPILNHLFEVGCLFSFKCAEVSTIEPSTGSSSNIQCCPWTSMRALVSIQTFSTSSFSILQPSKAVKVLAKINASIVNKPDFNASYASKDSYEKISELILYFLEISCADTVSTSINSQELAVIHFILSDLMTTAASATSVHMERFIGVVGSLSILVNNRIVAASEKDNCILLHTINNMLLSPISSISSYRGSPKSCSSPFQMDRDCDDRDGTDDALCSVNSSSSSDSMEDSSCIDYACRYDLLESALTNNNNNNNTCNNNINTCNNNINTSPSGNIRCIFDQNELLDFLVRLPVYHSALFSYLRNCKSISRGRAGVSFTTAARDSINSPTLQVAADPAVFNSGYLSLYGTVVSKVVASSSQPRLQANSTTNSTSINNCNSSSISDGRGPIASAASSEAIISRSLANQFGKLNKAFKSLESRDRGAFLYHANIATISVSLLGVSLRNAGLSSSMSPLLKSICSCLTSLITISVSHNEFLDMETSSAELIDALIFAFKDQGNYRSPLDAMTIASIVETIIIYSNFAASKWISRGNYIGALRLLNDVIRICSWSRFHGTSPITIKAPTGGPTNPNTGGGGGGGGISSSLPNQLNQNFLDHFAKLLGYWTLCIGRLYSTISETGNGRKMTEVIFSSTSSAGGCKGDRSCEMISEEDLGSSSISSSSRSSSNDYVSVGINSNPKGDCAISCLSSLSASIMADCASVPDAKDHLWIARYSFTHLAFELCNKVFSSDYGVEIGLLFQHIETLLSELYICSNNEIFSLSLLHARSESQSPAFQCLVLSIKSFGYWKSLCSSSKPNYSIENAPVYTSLKSVACTINPVIMSSLTTQVGRCNPLGGNSGFPSILVGDASTSSSSSSASSSSSFAINTAAINDSSDWAKPVYHFYVWVLLIQWELAINNNDGSCESPNGGSNTNSTTRTTKSTTSCSGNNSSGVSSNRGRRGNASEISIFLSCSVKALLKVIDVVKARISNSGAKSSVELDIYFAIIFPKQIKFLYFTLGTHGRLHEQVKVSDMLTSFAESFQVSSPSMSLLLTNILALEKDLTIHSIGLCVVNNFFSSTDKKLKIGQLHEIFSESAAKSFADRLNLRVNHVGSDKDGMSTLMEFLCALVGEVSSMKARSLSSFEALCSDATGRLLKSLSVGSPVAIGPPNSNSSNNEFAIFSPSTRALVLLAAAKVYLVKYGMHKRSYSFCKGALDLLAPYGKSYLSPTSIASSPLGVNLDSLNVRLEACLLASDILEQCGSLDYSLGYLAEASALSAHSFRKNNSRAFQSITQLHSIRILHRTNSLKVAGLVDDLLVNDEFSIEDSYDYYTLLCQESVRTMQRQGLVIGEVQEDDGGLGRDVIKFRYQHQYWGAGLGPQSCLGFAASSTTAGSGVGGGCEMHELLDGNMKIDGFESSSSHVNNDEYYCNMSLCFDFVRSYRRAKYSTMLHTSSYPELFKNSNSTINSGSSCNIPLRAFILGSSSINTSLECGELLKMEHSISNDNDNSSSNNSTSYMIHKSCCGDSSAVNLARDRVSYLLNSLNRESPTFTRICFIAIDRKLSELHIGTYDTLYSAVVAKVAISDKQLAKLDSWTRIMDQNTNDLKVTFDVERVKQWTNNDKKKWWDSRYNNDATLCSYLQFCESLLGVWIHLLSGHPIASRSEAIECIQVAFPRSKTYFFPSKTQIPGLQPNEIGIPVGADIESFIALVQIALGCGLQKDSSSSSFEVLSKDVSMILSRPNVANIKSIENFLGATSDEISKRLTKIMLTATAPLQSHHPGSAAFTDRATSSSSSGSTVTFNIPSSDKKIKVPSAEDPSQSGSNNENFNHGNKSQRSQLPASGSRSSTNSQQKVTTSSATTAMTAPKALGNLIMMLDETLQSIPWECIPALKHVSSTRIPGLNVLLKIGSMFKSPQSPSSGLHSSSSSSSSVFGSDLSRLAVAPKSPAGPFFKTNVSTTSPIIPNNIPNPTSMTPGKAWYLVDPDGNLPSTRQTMTDFIKPFADRWNWKGYVGHYPDASVAIENNRNSNLYIYCGHGSGDKVYRNCRLVDEGVSGGGRSSSGSGNGVGADSGNIATSVDMDRGGRGSGALNLEVSSSMLWGCSSGKLRPMGVHDPQGPVVNYMLAGAQFVIGNLWDVTDKDIDKLSMQCMQTLFSNRSNSSNNSSSGNSNSSSSTGSGSGSWEGGEDAMEISSFSNSYSDPFKVSNGSLASIANSTVLSSSSSSTLTASPAPVKVTSALASSRGVCKLPHVVGCAPVTYGLPINFKLKS